VSFTNLSKRRHLDVIPTPVTATDGDNRGVHGMRCYAVNAAHDAEQQAIETPLQAFDLRAREFGSHADSQADGSPWTL